MAIMPMPMPCPGPTRAGCERPPTRLARRQHTGLSGRPAWTRERVRRDGVLRGFGNAFRKTQSKTEHLKKEHTKLMLNGSPLRTLYVKSTDCTVLCTIQTEVRSAHPHVSPSRIVCLCACVLVCLCLCLVSPFVRGAQLVPPSTTFLRAGLAVAQSRSAMLVPAVSNASGAMVCIRHGRCEEWRGDCGGDRLLLVVTRLWP